MKFLESLLGFAVLTGPLWLILILLPVFIWIAVKISKRYKQRKYRLIVGLLAFLVVFCVSFADVMIGRLYHSYLCASEEGVKVYQIVELPEEYWDEQGKPKFINNRGILDMVLLNNRFEWRNVREPEIDVFITITKQRWILQDKHSQQNLGEKITFNRYFGWLNRFSPAPNKAESCRNIWADKYGRDALLQKENSAEIDFILKIFKQSETSK